MKKEIRAKNAKLRHDYQMYLADAKGNCEKTVTQKLSHIYAYEKYFNKDLTQCGKKEYFSQFKSYLRNDKKVSLTTYSNNCRSIYEFYFMLSFSTKSKNVTSLYDLEYLSIKKKERNGLKSATNLKEIPTIDEFKALVESIEIKNELDLRNRALLIFLLFSPSRVDSTIHLKLKHFIKENLEIRMDTTKDITTKGGYANWARMLVFEPKYLSHFLEYLDYLYTTLGFSEDDPIFPATLSEMKDSNCYFTSERLSKNAWKRSLSVRKVLKDLAKKTKSKFYSPHRYRDLHYYLARKCCNNEEERNAVEMNMGHRGRSTAEIYYGNVGKYERFDILRRVDFSKHDQNKTLSLDDIFNEILSLKEEINFQKRND